MVDLPRTPLDSSVTQGPRSSVSGGEIRSAFGELAANLDEAVGTLENAAIEKASLEGQGAVYKDEKTGNLTYDSRNPLSRAGTAFNRSARTAYVSQISMDARPAIANLEVEAKGNVGEFDKLSNAYLKEMLKGKDPLLKGAIQSELTGAITSSRTGMIRAQQARDIQSQDKSISARINMANEDAAALARSGGTNTREYAEQLDIIRTLEKEKVGNPLFAYSQAESDVFLRGVEGSHMAEAIVGQVEKIYNQPGGGLKAAQDFAEKSFDDPALQLSPAERVRYRNAARGALGQFKAELKVERDEAREDAKRLKDEMAGAGNVNDEDVDAVARRLENAGDGARAIQLRRQHASAKQMATFDSGNDEQQTAMLARVQGGGDSAALLIKQFEGFRETPYFDVNALRTGYGSDTVTRVGGIVEPVVQGTRVSRADAERDLTRRIGNYQAAAREKVGGAEWDSLSKATKAALTSVAYNYGSLPDRVITAIRSGDNERIALAVEGLAGDNDGINAGRRGQEASIIRGGLGVGIDSKTYASMRKEVLSDTKASVENMKAGFAKGDTMSPDDLNLLGIQVAALGDREFSDEVVGFLKMTGDYSTETLAGMRRQMQEIEADGVSVIEQDAYTMMNAVYNKTVEGIKNDPLSLASSRGIIPAIEPLDMANPNSFAIGLVDRQRSVSLTERRYGITDAAALTADEVEVATKTLATAPIEQRVQMLSTMSQSLKPQTYMATMAKIADKSGPVLGIAGGLYAKNPDVAESVMRGSELLKITPALLPSAGDKNKALIQASLPYQAFAPGMDAARSGFLEAASARYADLSSQSGDTTGEFSEARMNQAVKDVTGGLVEFNGASMFPPEHGMDQSSFDTMMASLNERDVEGAQTSSGTMISAEVIRDNGQLRAIGEGRYLVQLSNASRGPGAVSLPYVTTASGQPFILDLTGRARHMRDVNG